MSLMLAAYGITLAMIGPPPGPSTLDLSGESISETEHRRPTSYASPKSRTGAQTMERIRFAPSWIVYQPRPVA